MGLQGFVVVGLGAALGAWLRWGLGLLLNAVFPLLPLGTLIANLSGGLMMGIAMGLISSNAGLSEEVRLLVMTGFLGGLTTFSTFSAESASLFASGEYGWAAAHILTHVAGSILMTILGIYLFHLVKA